SLVSTSTGYEDFADCDLVLEAVFEELEIKKQVFAELREHVPAECVLATNTSGLSVAEMGADVGIHFFNPVAVLPLVELVRKDEIVVQGDEQKGEDEILEAALEAVADEIRHLLEEGVVAEAKDVDTALLLGAGWPFWLGGITKYLDQTGRSERMFGRPLAEIGVASPAAAS